ncbi:MAG: hypothetical protein RMM53_09335, partial [Bacteroidia bacterium]|nr:hypothetical protein [Bacteroidia bacterium]MDW8334403.1 hypothetical protein [Bacteroidia bacterium]
MNGRMALFYALIWLLCSPALRAQSIEKGIEELERANYATAFEVFNKQYRKGHPAAAFTLAKYYASEKAPFANPDSAYKYCKKAMEVFRQSDAKTRLKLAELGAADYAVLELEKKIADQQFERALKIGTVEALEAYLEKNLGGRNKARAIAVRDSIAFQAAVKDGRAAAFKAFLEKYPAAAQAIEARSRYEAAFFREQTAANTVEAYHQFQVKHPESPYAAAAEDSVFYLATRDKREEQYYNFIKLYPQNRHVPRAWEAIFSFYESKLSLDELVRFELTYPDHPLRNRVNDAAERLKAEMLPIVLNGKWGFSDR